MSEAQRVSLSGFDRTHIVERPSGLFEGFVRTFCGKTGKPDDPHQGAQNCGVCKKKEKESRGIVPRKRRQSLNG